MSNLPRQPWSNRLDDAMKIVDADGNSVAMVMQTHLNGRRTYEEATAIRDLLAAAPDLLEACKVALMMVEGPPGFVPNWDLLRAAIKKAEPGAGKGA